MLSLPVLLLSIGIAATCSITAAGCLGGLIQPGITLVTFIIALFTWPYIGRIVRGQVLSLREKEFIESARSLGSGGVRIMFREVLPNLAAPIIVYGTLIIPSNILFEASLSFLGVGIPPETPSWGRMISEASSGQLYTVAWWMLLFPGIGAGAHDPRVQPRGRRAAGRARSSNPGLTVRTERRRPERRPEGGGAVTQRVRRRHAVPTSVVLDHSRR